jgi:hypothetical protein
MSLLQREYSPPKEIVNDVKAILNELSSNSVLMSKDTEIAKTIKTIMEKKDITLYRGKGCPKCEMVQRKNRNF